MIFSIISVHLFTVFTLFQQQLFNPLVIALFFKVIQHPFNFGVSFFQEKVLIRIRAISEDLSVPLSILYILRLIFVVHRVNYDVSDRISFIIEVIDRLVIKDL